MAQELNPKALGLSLGIVWAFAVAFFALLGNGWGGPMMDILALYPGFSTTPTGALIGAAWAFVDAFIGGYIVAWLYNYFNK